MKYVADDGRDGGNQMINFNISLPEQCFSRDKTMDGDYGDYYKLLPYGDWYWTKATHIKEIWHDGEEYFSYELGYFKGKEWVWLFCWNAEADSILEGVQ